MRSDKLTVHDLFQKERRYVVPLYQRSYVWNLEEQWEPLWEDIERQAEACLTADNNVARRSHFLGAIVLNVAKIVGGGIARSEIIDGQQRLTSWADPRRRHRAGRMTPNSRLRGYLSRCM